MLGGGLPGRAGKIRADLRPGVPAVAGLPQGVSREKEDLGSTEEKSTGAVSQSPDRLARGRLRPHGSAPGRCAGRARDPPAAVDDVGIQRIRRGIAIFVDSNRAPLAHGDLAVVAAAGYAGRSAFLAGRCRDGRGTRCRRDVITAAPSAGCTTNSRLAAVDCDDRPLVGRRQNDVRIVGVDPERW